MTRDLERSDDNAIEARIVDEALGDLERFGIITG